MTCPPTIRNRETLTSFVSRWAAFRWVDARTFCNEKAFSFQEVIDGNDRVALKLADFNLSVPQSSLDWSPLKRPNSERALKGHLFPSKVIQSPQMRGCPICLRLDAEGSDGEQHVAMAMRGDWLVPHVTFCQTHCHPLVQLWRDAKPFTRLDSAVHLATLAPDIMSGSLEQGLRAPTDFETWIDDRLNGTRNDTWLDTFSLNIASNFCFMLGSSLQRLEEAKDPRTSAPSQSEINQLGFAIASHGEQAVLGELHKLQRLPGKPLNGPKGVFPVLYERLAHQYQNNAEYEPFRDLLRTHMMKTWPLGIGDEVLGEPVIKRRLHSVRTAANSTGVDQRRLFKMLLASGIVKGTEAGEPDYWEVFDAQSAAPHLEEITKLVPATTFAGLICASRSQLDLLVADGVILPALPDSRTKSIWNPQDGIDFLDSIFIKSTPIRHTPPGWESISKAAQRLKVSPGKIIRAIWNGKIGQVGNYKRAQGYGAIYVNYNEALAVLGDEPPPAISIEIFAKSVGVNQPSRMRKLVMNGHVQATTMQNPRTKADQFYFTRSDSEAFHAEFLTPRTMSIAFSRSWQGIGAELKAKNVMPFAPAGEDYGRLFRRDEVEAALQ